MAVAVHRQGQHYRHERSANRFGNPLPLTPRPDISVDHLGYTLTEPGRQGCAIYRRSDPAGAMLVQNPELSQRGAIGGQLVRRDRLGMNALVLEEPAQKLHGSCGVPTLLDQDVEPLALIVDGAPRPEALSLDKDHGFIQRPVGGPRRRGILAAFNGPKGLTQQRMVS